MTRRPRARAALSRPLLLTTGTLVASQALMAVAGILAARPLGPDGKGVVAAVVTWMQMLGWLSLCGLNTAASVVIAGSGARELRTRLGNAVAYSFVVGGIASVLGIVVVAPMLHDLGSGATLVAAWAFLAVPLAVLSEVVLSVDLALGRAKVFNLSRLGGALVLLLGTSCLVSLHTVTPARVVALTVASGGVTLALAAVGLPWRGISLRLYALLADVRFGVKVHLVSLIGLANLKLDILLMSSMVAASQVGLYSLATNLMMPIGAIGSAAAVLITPRVARLGRDAVAEGIAERQLGLVQRTAACSVAAAAAAGVLLALGAPLAVPLLFGTAFGAAVPLVWVLIPGYVARTYGIIISSGAIGMRRTAIGNVSEVVALAVTVAALPLLLPRYGAMGAAIASTLAYSTSAATAFVLLRRTRRRARSPLATAFPGLAAPHS